MNPSEQLRASIAALQLRGLKSSAKWCAEILQGLADDRSTPVGGVGGAAAAAMTKAKVSPSQTALLHHTDAHVSNRYLLAKTYFDIGEFQRCAFVLHPSSGDNTAGGNDRSSGALLRSSPAAGSELRGLAPEELFLKAYALYLAGEKAKEQEALETRDPLDRTKTVNPNLKPLNAELAELYLEGQLDAFGLYIFGVVLKELGVAVSPSQGSAHGSADMSADAFTVLSQSCWLFPWNWSCWVDLCEVCVEHEQSCAPEDVHASHTHRTTHRNPFSLSDGQEEEEEEEEEGERAFNPQEQEEEDPAPWCRDFFVAHALMELGGAGECADALQRLSELRERFVPFSTYALGQVALAQYSLRDFAAAESSFEQVRQEDPFRLDNLDTFSNILYVKESRARLSHLAHVATKNDKYRPETCCIVGNYYSLKAQHQKAVLYFQRALKLNRRFLAAWTLMGHEFVEMKNTGAAIESYRRGVDVNPRDYRAWYGLGQTYEILTMFFYALYYYRKAVKLRPGDARMWCALANCYRKLERFDEAIRAFERAATNQDQEGIACLELARLYSARSTKTQQRSHNSFSSPSSSSGGGAIVISGVDSGGGVGVGWEADRRKAAENYRAHLDATDRGPDRPVQRNDGVAEALKYLSHFAKDHGHLSAAAKYCSRLLECGGAEEEWAKTQLREIRIAERRLGESDE